MLWAIVIKGNPVKTPTVTAKAENKRFINIFPSFVVFENTVACGLLSKNAYNDGLKNGRLVVKLTQSTEAAVKTQRQVKEIEEFERSP